MTSKQTKPYTGQALSHDEASRVVRVRGSLALHAWLTTLTPTQVGEVLEGVRQHLLPKTPCIQPSTVAAPPALTSVQHHLLEHLRHPNRYLVLLSEGLQAYIEDWGAVALEDVRALERAGYVVECRGKRHPCGGKVYDLNPTLEVG